MNDIKQKWMTDEQLVKGCLRNDEQAQHQLYNRFSGQMMAICIRYIGDYDEAQDVFQEGFIKVFQKLHLYNGSGPLGAWIRRTIVNCALDYLRKQQRESAGVRLYKVDYMISADENENPFEEEEQVVSPERLTELIGQMPKGYRTVFNLFAVEEYSHKEIAESLEISESTSKTQYKKAKAYLRKLIELDKKTAGE